MDNLTREEQRALGRADVLLLLGCLVICVAAGLQWGVVAMLFVLGGFFLLLGVIHAMAVGLRK